MTQRRGSKAAVITNAVPQFITLIAGIGQSIGEDLAGQPAKAKIV